MKNQWRVMVVDDEAIMRESLAAWLQEDGYAVDTAASGREALALAAEQEHAVYFVDLKMPPGMDGIETMQGLRKLHPDASVFIITAYATVDTAITAMKEGAVDYLVKPCNPHEISLLMERLIRVKTLERENLVLRQKLTGRYSFQNIVSKNARMLELLELVKNVAGYRSTVLIRGESGTGKELFARAIHMCGDRADGPFVAVSCAALTETLLESELFGYERGAFTGAKDRRKGKCELANGGTLFLDEMGDISPKLQADLLRVLQERRFFRVGGNEEVVLDARVIAATHVDLETAVREGRFRQDLYFRLNVIEIEVPPLRERLEDIPLLARHFLERLSFELGKPMVDLSDGAVRALMAHGWPGNVRELENAIERAIVSARDAVLSEADFAFLERPSLTPDGGADLGTVTLQDLERRAIEATLRRTQGNVKEAAQVLGIDRSTLYEKLKRYDITNPRKG
ncbi:MAG: sigma-54-dependent Fis family transcriptional regulator [Deltaproteobacteria bacterium]|nr:MAG: sigma-54-dependent Fis family transcriptional regulator [Deltaproteobacteria bacterium]